MLNEITSENRLNNTTTEPTLQNSAVKVIEYNRLIPVINGLTSGINGGLSGGAANAYTLTLSGVDTPTGLTGKDGLAFDVQFSATNTGVSTLNFNGSGVKDIRKNGLDPLSASDIIASQVYRVYYDQTNDVWILEGQIGTGGGVPTLAGNNAFTGVNSFNQPILYSTAPALTALAGGGQGGATPIVKEWNNFTTVATDGDSGLLPVLVAGALQPMLVVKNNGVADLEVFPNTGDTINGGSANASVILVPGATSVFRGTGATDWEATIAAPISGPTYSLGLASTYFALTGTTLTLTNPQLFTTGDIGETTLVGTPSFGTGSDLGTTGLSAALADALTLYNTLKALSGTAIPTPAAIESDNYGYGLGVFVPGVYTTASAIGMTAANSITLSGDGDYVFVSTGGAITFGATCNIILTNGAKASRIFWVANNAITTGSTDSLKGNFMSGAAGAITIGSTNTIEGRLISPVATTVDGTATNFYKPLS